MHRSGWQRHGTGLLGCALVAARHGRCSSGGLLAGTAGAGLLGQPPAGRRGRVLLAVLASAKPNRLYG